MRADIDRHMAIHLNTSVRTVAMKIERYVFQLQISKNSFRLLLFYISLRIILSLLQNFELSESRSIFKEQISLVGDLL